MKVMSIVLVSLVLVGMTGCGGGPDNNVVIKTDYDPMVVIKEALEGVKSSGQLDSRFSGVMNAARDLKTTDPAKGEALEKQLTDLGALKDVAKKKAKADEIIKSL